MDNYNEKRTQAGINKTTFKLGGPPLGVVGNTSLQYLQYFFCDISLLTILSNRQVSHFT